ncbi:MAG: S1 RNA-binding domain-containing protein, partial [Anaerolineae bacterium]
MTDQEKVTAGGADTVEGPAPEAPAPEAAAAPPEAGKEPKAPARRGRPRLRLEDLVVGTETHGKVVGISKFGAFVDIGAVTDGLVHISELSDRRVRNVEDVVKSGTAVDVWIKEIDVSKSRISLSMRRKPNRPLDSLRPGNVLTGRVTSVTRYGAFVDIGSETEGLVHVSEMSSGFVQNPQDVVEVGTDVQVRI